MINPLTIAALLLAFLCGFLTGYLLGLRNGERLGRDKEWMDSFFRSIDKDKLRRDRLGRFKNTK